LISIHPPDPKNKAYLFQAFEREISAGEECWVWPHRLQVLGKTKSKRRRSPKQQEVTRRLVKAARKKKFDQGKLV
jgi:hypothetical protein